MPGSELNWGWAWPANRRVLYNRASADLNGQALERAEEVGLVGRASSGPGTTRRTSPRPRRPTRPADPKGIGLDALSGRQPFIMMPDGDGLALQPVRSAGRPAADPLRAGRIAGAEPALPAAVAARCSNTGSGTTTRSPAVADPRFPYVITTYRLTEHYLSGVMSRWNPWLAELMPELFIELSPELAGEKGIRNTDWVRISTPRAQHPGQGAGHPPACGRSGWEDKVVHQVGMPWHWGWEGVVTGDVVNTLTALVGDPNVTIHEGKAFVCNVEKA